MTVYSLEFVIVGKNDMIHFYYWQFLTIDSSCFSPGVQDKVPMAYGVVILILQCVVSRLLGRLVVGL